MRRLPVTALSVLLTAAALGPASAAEPPLLTIEQLADGVFAFRPTDEAMNAWRAISNSGAVVLDDGVLIFDSHWTPAHVEAARGLLAEHTDLPIRYVVLSHFHGDHTGGAWAYAGEVELISHHETRRLLDEELAKAPGELPQQIAQQQERLAAAEDPLLRQRMGTMLRYDQELLALLVSDAMRPLPSLTFDSGVVLYRGRTVEVHFLGRGHTRGDAIVYLPAEKIAFLGDLVFHHMLPNLNDGFSDEWIETLNKVLELGATRVVPGHGAVAGAEAIREQIDYLEWLRAAVEPFVRQDAGVDAAVEGIALPERFADYGFAMFLPGNVRKVYQEMTAGP